MFTRFALRGGIGFPWDDFWKSVGSKTEANNQEVSPSPVKSHPDTSAYTITHWNAASARSLKMHCGRCGQPNDTNCGAEKADSNQLGNSK
jgi:hypothetical protein